MNGTPNVDELFEMLTDDELGFIERDEPVSFAWSFVKRHHLPVVFAGQLKKVCAELRARLGYTARTD